MSGTSRVSVVMPTFNRGPALRTTLERLLASDLDAGDDLEILVVDDGSSPAAEGVIARTGPLPGRWPLTWIRQENAGPAAARNAGFRAARGEVVLFVDDDILVPPGLVRAHLAAHRARPGSVIFGLCPFVVSSRPTPFARYLESVPDLRPGAPDEMVPMSTVASGQISIERRQFEAGGSVYSSALATPAAEEFELAHRLQARGVPVLAAVGILAEHDQPVEVGAYCVQQYKHGLGCGEVAARQPEVMRLPALGRVIEASRPRTGSGSLREGPKRMLTRPAFRRTLIGVARALEYVPLPARLRALLYRAAISSHFVAGVRDGLSRFGPAPSTSGTAPPRG